jgi:hypothetical protein
LALQVNAIQTDATGDNPRIAAPPDALDIAGPWVAADDPRGSATAQWSQSRIRRRTKPSVVLGGKLRLTHSTSANLSK